VIVLEFGQPLARSARCSAPTAGRDAVVGGLLTGNRAAYQYLPRTAAAFRRARNSWS